VLDALGELLGLVLPVVCAGCGAVSTRLCPLCGAELRAARPVPVDTSSPVPVLAGAVYSGRVRRVLLAWKDGGRHDVAPVLARVLSRALLALLAPAHGAGVPPDATSVPNPAEGDPSSGVPRPPGRFVGSPGGRTSPIVLVPVPSRHSARCRRGGDLVRQITCTAARIIRARGVQVRVVPALHFCRPAVDQAGLGRKARAGNLVGALRTRATARALVAGQRCVIVDDVITTGATVREASRALAEARGVTVGIVATCATPLRRGLSGIAHLD
jgi:predicted amidophosphoribosyltransferase